MKNKFKHGKFLFEKRKSDDLWFCVSDSRIDCSKCFVCPNSAQDCIYIDRKDFHKIVEKKIKKIKLLKILEEI